MHSDPVSTINMPGSSVSESVLSSWHRSGEPAAISAAPSSHSLPKQPLRHRQRQLTGVHEAVQGCA